MVLLAVLEGPLLLWLVSWLSGVNVGSFLELGQLDRSPSEVVGPLLLDAIVREPLVGHEHVLVDDEICVETFEKNGLRMQQGGDGVILRVIHELLGLFWVITPLVLCESDVVYSITLRVVLVFHSNMKGKLGSFTELTTRHNVEALAANELLPVHSRLE